MPTRLSGNATAIACSAMPIRPKPMRIRFDGAASGASAVERPGGESLRGFERIEDENGTGFLELSVSFRSVALGRRAPPYRVCAILERP